MTSKYDMILLGLALFAGTASAQVSQARPPYLDPTLPIERRIDDLLARMTLDEKVGQMLCLWQGKRAMTDSAGRFDASRVSDWFRIGIGRIERPSEGHGARAEAEYTNAIQRWVKEHTRLGIPVLFHEEALHGLEGEQATSFPQAIALASTWNPDLVERVFTVAAAETVLVVVDPDLRGLPEAVRTPDGEPDGAQRSDGIVDVREVLREHLLPAEPLGIEGGDLMHVTAERGDQERGGKKTERRTHGE